MEERKEERKHPLDRLMEQHVKEHNKLVKALRRMRELNERFLEPEQRENQGERG